MKTLRARLLLAIGASFALFWILSALWTLVDLRREVDHALDERLAASARMVAALVAESPRLALSHNAGALQTRRRSAGAATISCEIRVLNNKLPGQVAAHPAPSDRSRTGFDTRLVDGVAWRSFTIEQNGISITTADRAEKRQALFQDIAWATFVPFLISMMATLAALWLAVRYCLRPLERVRRSLAARAPGALQALPHDRLPGELVPLVATVNELLSRVEQAIEREQRFTGDAAHELRTPLTAVKTHLQVARLSSDASQQAAALDHAEQGVKRLQNTIEQLLTLARVEGSVPFSGDESMDAGGIVAQTLSRMPSHAAARVAVLDDGGTALMVQMPASLAAVALRNILDNALRYSPPHSPVALHIRGSQDRVCFLVEDSGSGLSDVELCRAGERFWRKGGGQGSGLGLSTVGAIMARYGGCWSLRRREPFGTRACIELPALRKGLQPYVACTR